MNLAFQEGILIHLKIIKLYLNLKAMKNYLLKSGDKCLKEVVRKILNYLEKILSIIIIMIDLYDEKLFIIILYFIYDFFE